MSKLKKCACLLLCAVLCVSLLPLQGLASEEQCIHLASGNNVNRKYTSPYSAPAQSYLTVTPDGELMRFQAGMIDVEQYLVEYYDTRYQILRHVTVDAELPDFGGFYATDTNYYILSGQENPKESASVECFRVTKYDLKWNRLSSAGLYNCNTTDPFRAGNARFAQDGKYLLIRTCHEMYASSDGLNHQSNYTLRLDMEAMTLTGSDLGYVSHSFNQFIQVEDDSIVTVDHGDAYPRSIVLQRFPANDSTEWPTATDLLTFPGATGENYTGASLGSFEISDSSYLVAYNSVKQDGNFTSNRTRNVYIASMDKTTGQVTNKQITSLAEGGDTASIPHLVKLSGNEFLLLWMQMDDEYEYSDVRYVKLNGKGDKIGNVYTIKGASLSDCVPILANGKLIWYVWDDSVVTFYDINANNLSVNHRTDFDREAVSAYPTKPGGDYVTRCTVCGRTYHFPTPSEITAWWNTTGPGDYYYSWYWTNTFDLGTRVHFYVTYTYSSRNGLTVSVTDLNNGETLETGLEGVSASVEGFTYGSILFERPGRYKITISHLYNPLVSDSTTVEIRCAHSFASWKADNSAPHVCDICGITAGDVNEDGVIEATDYLLLKRAVLGTFNLTEGQTAVADVSGDGKVDSIDYLLVKRHVLGTYHIA